MHNGCTHPKTMRVTTLSLSQHTNCSQPQRLECYHSSFQTYTDRPVISKNPMHREMWFCQVHPFVDDVAHHIDGKRFYPIFNKMSPLLVVSYLVENELDSITITVTIEGLLEIQKDYRLIPQEWALHIALIFDTFVLRVRGTNEAVSPSAIIVDGPDCVVGAEGIMFV
ncbi:hypothetical protein BD779DRAFT_1517966 [Infundibulicybe gibba]|nr:hypothetical protein BD779DRAFT_1517966 [Infundibulicybe gibba]